MRKKLSIQEIRERIALALPEGKVVPRHTAAGHFYQVVHDIHVGITGMETIGPIYPSVTGKLQILKDESLINYKKNQVIQYFFRNFGKITQENLMEHLALAERVPEDVLMDASDIGTQIHDTRELIFSDWIKNGRRTKDSFTDWIDPAMPDIRLKSAIRALERFCNDYEYRPIATELYVYSHALKVAGTLDDLGMIRRLVRSGSDNHCLHEIVGNTCMMCGAKWKDVFVLLDIKSSNALKMSYWYQVSLYYEMFKKLVGVRPEMCFILKLSKEDGCYKIEEIRNLPKMVAYAKHMLKTHEGIEFVKEGRKDNQKIVSEKIEL